MSDIHTRLATPDDLETIQALNYKLFVFDAERDPYANSQWPFEEGEQYFRDRISGNGYCAVATVDSQVIGYVAGGLEGPKAYSRVLRCELENMFVEQAHRHLGAGRELVTGFFDWGKAEGADVFFVTACDGNDVAAAFYRSMNFEPMYRTFQTKPAAS